MFGGVVNVIIKILHPGVDLRRLLRFCLRVMRLNFKLIDTATLRLHLSIFDPLFQVLLLGHNICPDIGIEIFDLQLCLLEDFLHLRIISLIEKYMRLMLIFTSLEVRPLAIL